MWLISMLLPLPVLRCKYQSCRLTYSNAMLWMKMHRTTWPSNGVRTLRETRLAVGLLRHRVGYGPVQPTKPRVSCVGMETGEDGERTEDGYREDQEKVNEEEL